MRNRPGCDVTKGWGKGEGERRQNSGEWELEFADDALRSRRYWVYWNDFVNSMALFLGRTSRAETARWTGRQKGQ